MLSVSFWQYRKTSIDTDCIKEGFQYINYQLSFVGFPLFKDIKSSVPTHSYPENSLACLGAGGSEDHYIYGIPFGYITHTIIIAPSVTGGQYELGQPFSVLGTLGNLIVVALLSLFISWIIFRHNSKKIHHDSRSGLTIGSGKST